MADLRALTGGVGRLAFRLRLAIWAQDRAEVASLIGALDHAPPMSSLEHLLVTSVRDVLQGAPWPPIRAKILGKIGTATAGSARRRAFMAQIAVELACVAGDVRTALDLLEFAVTHGLFDRHWLERCPALVEVRRQAAYPALRDQVARRADAVLDGRFGDVSAPVSSDTVVTGAGTGPR